LKSFKVCYSRFWAVSIFFSPGMCNSIGKYATFQ
jgi:hypothetical protein